MGDYYLESKKQLPYIFISINKHKNTKSLIYESLAIILGHIQDVLRPYLFTSRDRTFTFFVSLLPTNFHHNPLVKQGSCQSLAWSIILILHMASVYQQSPSTFSGSQISCPFNNPPWDLISQVLPVCRLCSNKQHQ